MITFDKKSGFFHSSLIKNKHGFGTKAVGDGRKKETSKLIKELIPASILITPQQTHSTNINVIINRDQVISSPTNTDGLITNLKGIILSVITADCVPVLYEDTNEGIIGISHQGWKGTLGQLPTKMIAKMKELGSKPEDIHCAIGPAINECCYEVSTELSEQFNQVFGPSVISKRYKKPCINLLKANYQLFLAAGIQKEHMDYFPFCTSCNENEFWSYRRDIGIIGEMISYILL